MMCVNFIGFFTPSFFCFLMQNIKCPTVAATFGIKFIFREYCAQKRDMFVTKRKEKKQKIDTTNHAERSVYTRNKKN